jgi:hypothetical protein
MRRLALRAGFAVVLVAAAFDSAIGQTAGNRMRITAASNVRLRVSPSVEVAIAASLPLGADLVELGATPDGEWIRVRTTEGTEGWISEPLTKVVPGGQRVHVIEEIAAERTKGSYGFDAAIELAALIETVESRAADAEQQARLALYRLRALRDAAWSSWLDSGMPDEMRAWFRARPELFFYNEPGGQWMLRYEAIMQAHERHRRTAVAHDIAWLAVANGLGGECEGDVVCHAERANRVEGTYLREYPAGTMLDAALRRLLTWSITWRSHQRDPRVFVASRDCQRLRVPLAALRSAVAGATMRSTGVETLQMEVIRLLDLVAVPCRQGT